MKLTFIARTSIPSEYYCRPPSVIYQHDSITNFTALTFLVSALKLRKEVKT